MYERKATQLEQAFFSSLDFPPGSSSYTFSVLLTVFSKIIVKDYYIHCPNLSAILAGACTEHWVKNQKAWVLIFVPSFISHVTGGKPLLSSFINGCNCLPSHSDLWDILNEIMYVRALCRL